MNIRYPQNMSGLKVNDIVTTNCKVRYRVMVAPRAFTIPNAKCLAEIVNGPFAGERSFLLENEINWEAGVFTVTEKELVTA